MDKSIDQVFDSFKKLKVLIIGDVMIDAYYWGKVDRISPEAPVPIVAVSKKENRLGGAANVAINIQALGASPILCSVIGTDDNGKLFEKLLKNQGLSNKGIIKSKERVTIVKTRIIGNNHQMLRIDEEEDSDITKQETKELLNAITDIVHSEKIDVIIFEDYDKGVITKELIENVVKEGKEKNIPIAVDPKRKNFRYYHNVTLFKPNLKELKEGLKADFDHKNIESLQHAVDVLQRGQKIKIALVTLSEQGVYVSNGTNKSVIPAHVRNIADVSGAGDTVISVAALCLALDLGSEQIATLSNLAGGLVCEKTGVVAIDKGQLYVEAAAIYQ
jgi:D-glycero-beta-D-manno-heptose-7-phosphate kinase